MEFCSDACGPKAVGIVRGEPSDASDGLGSEEYCANDWEAEGTEDIGGEASDGGINGAAATDSVGISVEVFVVVVTEVGMFAAIPLLDAANEVSLDNEELLEDGAGKDDEPDCVGSTAERALLKLLSPLAEEVVLEVRFLGGGNISELKLLAGEPNDKPFASGPPCPRAVDARKLNTAPHLQNIVDANGEEGNDSRSSKLATPTIIAWPIGGSGRERGRQSRANGSGGERTTKIYLTMQCVGEGEMRDASIDVNARWHGLQRCQADGWGIYRAGMGSRTASSATRVECRPTTARCCSSSRARLPGCPAWRTTDSERDCHPDHVDRAPTGLGADARGPSPRRFCSPTTSAMPCQRWAERLPADSGESQTRAMMCLLSGACSRAEGRA